MGSHLDSWLEVQFTLQPVDAQGKIRSAHELSGHSCHRLTDGEMADAECGRDLTLRKDWYRVGPVQLLDKT